MMKVPVSRPYMGEKEISYVNQALQSNAVSGVFGEFIDRFESGFASFCGTKFGVSCSNGTTALHLALAACEIGSGDEVLVSTLTNMASFFAVIYTGAKPIPVDIDPRTLTMDPEHLKTKITPKTKAIMVVHLFGQATEMDPVNELAKKHGLLVIEDCAEAHGATYKGKKAGNLGDVGCFSFFANKILTTGEGGMLTTNNPTIAEKARSLKALAFGKTNKFMHTDIGYNYRMTNLQAAIGCGQVEVADKLIEKRRQIAKFYESRLDKFREHLALPIERPHAKNVYWMYHLSLKGKLSSRRTEIMNDLRSRGIETREGFIPYNLQEIFIQRGWTKAEDCPRANEVAYTSFYLPTGPEISQEELAYVADHFESIIAPML
jgi:perosamine synthetase